MQEINKTKSKYDCNKQQRVGVGGGVGLIFYCFDNQDISIIIGLDEWCPYIYTSQVGFVDGYDNANCQVCSALANIRGGGGGGYQQNYGVFCYLPN